MTPPPAAPITFSSQCMNCATTTGCDVYIVDETATVVDLVDESCTWLR